MSTPTTNRGYIKAAEGEQYDLDIINNNLDAVDTDMKARIDFDDKAPLGVLYQSHVQSSSGSVADAIINNIATFTFKANRKYKIAWDFSYIQGGPSSLFFCSIGFAPVGDGAASLANITVLEGRTKGINPNLAGSTQHTGPIVAYHHEGGVDRIAQIKFRVQRVVGGDLMTVVGNANERAIYSIVDEGYQTGTFN